MADARKAGKLSADVLFQGLSYLCGRIYDSHVGAIKRSTASQCETGDVASGTTGELIKHILQPKPCKMGGFLLGLLPTLYS